MTETNARTREIAEKIAHYMLDHYGENSSTWGMCFDFAEKALLSEREEARREAIEECAEIVHHHDCMHCGYVGSVDNCLTGALLALLKKGA